MTLYVFAVACESQEKTTNKSVVTQPKLKPWEFSTDSLYALKYTDQYAWELFRALNWPADTVTMEPDTASKFGSAGVVVWQTWKSAVETFLPNGQAPKDFMDKKFGLKTMADFASFSVKAQLNDITSDPTFGIEDVAMNQPTFNYIVKNELYNLNGQLAVYNSDSTVRFPAGAMEVKVKWRQIADTKYSKARYHWQYIAVEDSGAIDTLLYGMASMHISSRIISNWVWATFEHIDSRSQVHPGDDGWLLTSKDEFACDLPPFDCESAPRNFKLEGTKWEYYRLRGTQTNYVESNGDTSLLANSNIERGFQMSSSCITCHSLASIGPVTLPKHDMQRVDFIRSTMMEDSVLFGGRGYVGIPDSNLFKLADGSRMKRADFVWTLARAVWLPKDSASVKK